MKQFRPEPPSGDPTLAPRHDYDLPDSLDRHHGKFESDGRGSVAPAAVCDTNAYVSASSSTIVNVVVSQDPTCTYPLFSLSGTSATNTFTQSKMQAVASGIQSRASAYPGNNNTGVLQLTLFLRAGYYVAVNNNWPLATNATLLSGVQNALTSLFASSRSRDVSEGNGAVMYEVFTLLTNAHLESRFIYVYKDWLTRYNSSFNTNRMMAAVDAIFVVLFYGEGRSDFVAAINADTSLVTVLGDFVTRTSFNANTSNEWLTKDSAGELARFLSTTYAANVRTVARPLVRSVLQTYSFTSFGKTIYFQAASNASYYDSANCSYYGICNLRNDVIAAVQSQTYQCPQDAIRIVAQNMTTQQFADTCNTLHNQIPFIYNIFGVSTPVPGDNTASLEINVFDSAADYKTYGNYLYGIDTNNGGMYMEGDPSQVGNVAHFYCHRAEWLSQFEIWNLWHEFTHYMDGKYNMKGGFDDYPAWNADLPYSTVWWIEGIAEYVSYSYRNQINSGAVSFAAGSHTLPTLFNNTYDMAGYFDIAYTGGYLVTYFMVKNHNADINTLLGHFRAGAYTTGYRTWLDGIRNAYASEFTAFKTCFRNNNGTGCGTSSCTFSINPSSASYSASGGSGSVTVTASSSTCSRSATSNASWITVTGGASGSGNGTVSYSVAANSGTSSRTGTLTIAGKTFTVTQSGSGGSGTQLTNGVGITVSGATGSQNLYYIDVPSGATNLVMALSGGTGDADMYTRFGVAPTLTTYDCRPYANGNNETCTVAAPSAGRYYVLLNGYAAYSGATLRASFTSTTCSYSISPTSASYGASASSGSVSVTAGSGCSWTASSGASWITITAGASGSGNGTVSYSVAANSGTSSRTGTATIAGKTFTVTQAGGGSSGTALTNGVGIAVSGATGSQNLYYIDVPSGATNLVMALSGGTGDADMYTRFGSAPTLTTYDCRPYANGNNETCTVAAPSTGRYYILLNGYAAYSGATLRASFTAPTSSLRVISPNGGEVWTRGSTRTVSWSKGSAARVDVALYRGTTFVQWITWNNSGTSFNWTVPTSLTASSTYKVRVIDYDVRTSTDDSDSSFTIN